MFKCTDKNDKNLFYNLNIVLRDGKILTKDKLLYERDNCRAIVEIYTVKYNNEILYIKKVKDEFVDFRELK